MLTFAVLHSDLTSGVDSLNGTAILLEYDQFQDGIAASYGGTRAAILKRYRRRSAEFIPERLTMPVAGTTGGLDQLVPPHSAQRLVQSLQASHHEGDFSLHRVEGGHANNYADTVAVLEFVLDHAPLEQP